MPVSASHLSLRDIVVVGEMPFSIGLWHLTGLASPPPIFSLFCPVCGTSFRETRSVERNLLLASERCVGNAQRRAEPPTNTFVSARTQTPPSHSGLLQKKYYFCTVEQSRMSHDRTYRPVLHAPAPRLRDADGSMRPHTYGVRVCSCAAIATEPCRPTACAGEYPNPSAYTTTAHYSLLTANSTYTFSAKERDPETGLSYFGSRYYSSDLSIWLSVDPMSAKYPSLSPYTYCADNPVRCVDPNGEEINPIYDLNGFFLGTDDKGLQGKAIMMKREHFKQNMRHSAAELVGNIDKSIYSVSEEAKNRVNIHHASLPDRPDWDGKITDAEARDWYRTGQGAPLYINMEKLDLKPVTLEHFTKLEGNPYNFFFSISADKDIGRVYGAITLNLLNSETGEVQVGNPSTMYIDTYDFNSGGSWRRNCATQIASVIVGEGTPFKIYGWGKNPKISVK